MILNLMLDSVFMDEENINKTFENPIQIRWDLPIPRKGECIELEDFIYDTLDELGAMNLCWCVSFVNYTKRGIELELHGE